MNTSSEHLLYKHIEQWTKQFVYISDSGILADLHHIFTVMKHIQQFTLAFDQQSNHYKIAVVLDEWSEQNIREIFFGFYRFMGYDEAAIYARKPIEHGYHYLFATLQQHGGNFCCEIDFTAQNNALQVHFENNKASTLIKLNATESQ